MPNKAFVDYTIDTNDTYPPIYSTDLSSLDASRWATYNNNQDAHVVTAFADGGLTVDLQPYYGLAGISATTSYDLRGHAFSVYFADLGACIYGASYMLARLSLQPEQVTSDLAWYLFNQGNILPKYDLQYAIQSPNGWTYPTEDEPVHIRIREDGGTVFFDSSLDGISWTQRGSKPATEVTFDLSAVYPVLDMGHAAASGATPAPVLKDFAYSDITKITVARVTGAVILDSDSNILKSLGNGLPTNIDAAIDYGDSPDAIRNAVTTAVRTAAGDSTLNVTYPKYA